MSFFIRLVAVAFGSIAALAIALALTLPWWLGAALAWGGPHFGLQHERYERLGYGRFRLENVEWQRRSVRVRVESLEGDTPLLWLWRRFMGEVGTVYAGAWSTDVTRADPQHPPIGPRGWVPLRGRLTRVADRLAAWVPAAQIGPGVVRWANGTLTLAPVTWEQRVLSSPEIGYRGLRSAVELAVPADEPWRVDVRAADLDASAVLQSTGATVEGEIIWLEQRAPIVAQFHAEGWAPARATVSAGNWEVPAARVKLAQYASLHGGGRIDWSDGRLQIDVAVEGRPREESAAPPLVVKAQGHGDTRTFTTELLEIALPGVAARLTEPVVIDRAGRLQSANSAFRFAADLAQVPWVKGRGTITGEGRVQSGAEGAALVEFAWRGEGLVLAETDLRSFGAHGRLHWPQLDLTEGVVISATGDELRWAGGWNFRTREIRDASVAGRIRRETLARWLPAQPEFEAVEIEARAEGPWRTATHHGRAVATGVRLKGVNPFRTEARWRGEGVRIGDFAAEVRAGATILKVTGSGDQSHVRLTELELGNAGTVRLALAQPATFTWAPEWRLDPLRLTGPDAAIEAELAREEEWRITAALRGVQSEWLRDLVPLPPTNWTLDTMKIGARWDQGPVEFAAESLLTLQLGSGRTAQVAARANGDDEGIDLTSLRIGEGEAEIVNVTGRLPIVLRPGRRPMVAVDARVPFALNAMTTPNPKLWDQLAQLVGMEIIDPEVRARLSGTLEQPRGEARFRAQRLAPLPGRFTGQWPKIEALDFYLTGEEHGVRLDRFAVAVDGQEVRASGWLPFEAAQWRELIRDPRRYMRRGEFHVEVPDADVAVVAQYFPTYLAPKGRAQLDVTLAGEEGLRGFVRLHDAMLRPLGPLGVVQEIHADLRLEGRSAVVQSVTGRVGGQLVTLRGRAELPSRGEPRLDFTVQGENLPFVRRAGLLVRGDLDLTLTTPEGETPRIGGTVRLRDSLFLSDVRALIPSGTKAGENRPPYFAIQTAPLNAWGLDVRIAGERFMRLRTPVFNGTATARFHLTGTLGEPRATGEAIVDEGVIRLPFANFEVRQGQVRLTPEQPQPQIWVTAATRRFGYDLRLEITGPASTPALTFSSSPPLEAEQVLLLVMAGQPPNNEIATTDRQRAARFGAFFGQSLLGSLSGDPGGVDKLTISSGENVSEQGRETYNIEYRLNDRWALTGEYDEFDDYYGGIKWRFYQKGGEAPDED